MSTRIICFFAKKRFSKQSWTLADGEWRAAALGLKPLRLPRAQTHAHTHKYMHTLWIVFAKVTQQSMLSHDTVA